MSNLFVSTPQAATPAVTNTRTTNLVVLRGGCVIRSPSDSFAAGANNNNNKVVCMATMVRFGSLQDRHNCPTPAPALERIMGALRVAMHPTSMGMIGRGNLAQYPSRFLS